MARYRVRFFFDAGSRLCLWHADASTSAEFGHPPDPELLPVSAATRDMLADLCAEYDTSVNWDYPPDPGPWRQDDCDRFNARVESALRRLRDELEPEWDIVEEFEPVSPDPDLDRYLLDPKAFRRVAGPNPNTRAPD